MNHDYAHCLDYTKDCPKECFRAELQRDIEENRSEFVGVPMTYAHLRGTDECKLAKDKDVTYKMSFETDCIGRQSAIEEIARWIGYLDEDMILRIQMGLKKLPSAQQWIPVSEMMPKQGQTVICQCVAGIIEILKLDACGNWYQDANHCYMRRFVVAWMPLPAPWKGEEDERT